MTTESSSSPFVMSGSNKGTTTTQKNGSSSNTSSSNSNSKKYKLMSVTQLENGMKLPCAFFASPAGCRNGDQCKFAHIVGYNKNNQVCTTATNNTTTTGPPPAQPVPVPQNGSSNNNTKKQKKKNNNNSNTNNNQNNQNNNNNNLPTNLNTNQIHPMIQREIVSSESSDNEGQHQQSMMTTKKKNTMNNNMNNNNPPTTSSRFEIVQTNRSSQDRERENQFIEQLQLNNNNKNKNNQQNNNNSNTNQNQNNKRPVDNNSSNNTNNNNTMQNGGGRETKKGKIQPQQPFVYNSNNNSNNNNANNMTSSYSDMGQQGNHNNNNGQHNNNNNNIGQYKTNNNNNMNNNENAFKKSSQQQPPQYQRQQVVNNNNIKRECTTPEPTGDVPSFRKLDLPIASFSKSLSQQPVSSSSEIVDNNGSSSTVTTTNLNQGTSTPTDKKHMKQQHPDTMVLTIPNSHPIGREWSEWVHCTQQHRRFKRDYNMEQYLGSNNVFIGDAKDWIELKPYGLWCEKNPQMIAIDCEMCETMDPVSLQKDMNALCRISVVDALTNEILLDTLVKPNWPVSDYRTFVTGITVEDLTTVQFTIRHAQAFLLSLCSTETIITGHGVYNDLAALRIKNHTCVIDSACLFGSVAGPNITVSLKDVAKHVLDISMPNVHDSVHDAQIAFRCIEYYIQHYDATTKTTTNGTGVDLIPRSTTTNNNNAREMYGKQLFVHRIPYGSCTSQQIHEMIVSYTHVVPVDVDPIEFNNNNNNNSTTPTQGSPPPTPSSFGKTILHFHSRQHADLVFDTIGGKEETDNTGRIQKKIFLKKSGNSNNNNNNGNAYIRIRKMIYENK